MSIRSTVFALTATALLVATGCQYIRKVTYPPEFVYLERGRVTGTMRDLAVSVDRLDRILSDPALAEDERRRRVVAELAAMERSADSLGAGTAPTNHLLIDRHIDDFKADLVAARNAAAADPPAYYLAGRVIGACTACHVLR